MISSLSVSELVVKGTSLDVTIVDSVSFKIERGKILGLVGESGSGKTTLGLALLGYAKTGTHIASGAIRIGDIDITLANAHEARGKVVAYIPQSPASALNPALRLGIQLRECLPAGTKSPYEAIAATDRQILSEALPASIVGRPATTSHHRNGLDCTPSTYCA
jgi:peptide/nickel transport system ATP-binding protein